MVDLGDINPRRANPIGGGSYWVPALWLASIFVFSFFGYFLGNSNSASGFTASFGEAWKNTFGSQGSEYVHVIDVDEFEAPVIDTSDIRVVSTVVDNTAEVEMTNLPSVSESVVTTSTEERIVYEPCGVDNQDPSHEVLINEVAWAGEVDNPSKEWIELRNTQDEVVDLTGWRLQDLEESIYIVFEEGESIDEYLLLGRILARDDPDLEYKVGGVTLDKTYTGVIQNSEESLYLYNQDCELVDTVGGDWKDIGGTASPEYRSAERTDEGGWHTYSGELTSGVMGTPRALNSEAKELEETSSSEVDGDEQEKEVETVIVYRDIPDEPSGWCGQDDLNEPTGVVLINEVAWSGNATSTSQEWIELYTDIDGSLSLSGWQLLDKEGEIQIRFGEEKIEDYILLRRILASEDPEGVYEVGSKKADVTFTGTIQNSGETLRLFDASCNLVDEVTDVGENWENIGGSASPDYKTAERVDESSWQTYSGEGQFGVMGTPGGSSSVFEEPIEDEVEDEQESESDEETTEEEMSDDGHDEEVDDEEESEDMNDGEDEEDDSETDEDVEDGSDEEDVEEDNSDEGVVELIDINTASIDKLQEITGVGPVIAQRIIDYRDESGPFSSIEEIKNISGIGDVTFEGMKDQITV